MMKSLIEEYGQHGFLLAIIIFGVSMCFVQVSVHKEYKGTNQSSVIETEHGPNIYITILPSGERIATTVDGGMLLLHKEATVEK